MLIFLYGPDSYRSREKLQEIVEHYKKIHRSELNLRYFAGKDFDFADFKNELQITPMFKEKKLLVLSDAFLNKDFKENFLKAGKNLVKSSDNIVLFYEDAEPAKNDSLFVFLKKEAKLQEFQPLRGQSLKNWVKKELAKYPIKAGPEIIEKLIGDIGSDLWQFSNEIKKLAAYKNKGEISLGDIALLIRPKTDIDIFKTIDAIAQKNKKQAVRLIHKHLEKGDSPLYLLSMINFQFRNIIIIKDLLEKQKPLNYSHLHPFVIQKSRGLAQKFTFAELKKIYRKIFQVDHQIKTGKIEPETALDLLITEI